MDLKKSIKREDLTGTLGDIADLIGVDNAVALAEFTGGTALYIPLTKAALSKARDRQIKIEYMNGADAKDLAAKYGITRRYAEIICHGK